ncbi:mCG142125 [Mus musculus]|nr:mCG142125 [Mus musculus]
MDSTLLNHSSDWLHLWGFTQHSLAGVQCRF